MEPRGGSKCRLSMSLGPGHYYGPNRWDSSKFCDEVGYVGVIGGHPLHPALLWRNDRITAVTSVRVLRTASPNRRRRTFAHALSAEGPLNDHLLAKARSLPVPCQRTCSRVDTRRAFIGGELRVCGAQHPQDVPLGPLGPHDRLQRTSKAFRQADIAPVQAEPVKPTAPRDRPPDAVDQGRLDLECEMRKVVAQEVLRVEFDEIARAITPYDLDRVARV